MLSPVWEEAVGAALSRHSRPVRLENRALVVEVDPQLLDALESAVEMIRARLNERLGREAVARVQLVARGQSARPPGNRPRPRRRESHA